MGKKYSFQSFSLSKTVGKSKIFWCALCKLQISAIKDWAPEQRKNGRTFHFVYHEPKNKMYRGKKLIHLLHFSFVELFFFWIKNEFQWNASFYFSYFQETRTQLNFQLNGECVHWNLLLNSRNFRKRLQIHSNCKCGFIHVPIQNNNFSMKQHLPHRMRNKWFRMKRMFFF